MKKAVLATIAFLMVATFAAANNGPSGHPPMGGPGDMGSGPGGGLQVASNGTVILRSEAFDSATNTHTSTLKAISSSGTVLWSQTLTNQRGDIEISGSNILLTSDVVATDGTVTSTITAISLATGATSWTKTINGHVGDLTPFNGGTYAVVVIPATTSGGSATRSLIAISDAGSVLWSVTL